MKKVLLGTSAIALAGAFASQASANEWEVTVSGYMEQYVGYADNNLDSTSGDYDGMDVKGDKEVHFAGTITLDNGLTFGARYELEGTTSSDQIDENYMVIEGSFGQVRLGETDQVAFAMAYVAPDVTFLGINSGSDTKWYGGNLTALTATFPVAVYDPEEIAYYSPRFAGFQVGASYARDGNKATIQSQQDNDASGTVRDAWSVAANYVNSFGDFNVALSGGYATAAWKADSDSGDIESWGAGLNLGYGGFTIGGSYKEVDTGGDSFSFEEDCGCSDGEIDFVTSSTVGIAETVDNEVWDLGASYETGPWGFSITYIDYSDDKDLDVQRYLLGVNYKLAKGVQLGAFGSYSRAEDDPADETDKAWLIGTGVKLNF